MPQDLPVTAIAAIPNTAPNVVPQDRATEAPVPVAPSSRPFPNPSLRLDAGLGMVVIEFRDNLGEVTNSIPSQRILEAYRAHTEPLLGSSKKPGPTTPASDDRKAPERFA